MLQHFGGDLATEQCGTKTINVCPWSRLDGAGHCTWRAGTHCRPTHLHPKDLLDHIQRDDAGAWVSSLAPSLGAFSVAAELPVLDGTREGFIENPSMFQIHDDFQNRQVLLFQNFSVELLPNSLATRRRHAVVLAFTHCFDKQF